MTVVTNEIAAVFLNAGANVNATTADGDTALIMACRDRSIDCIRTLLLHETDTSIKDISGRLAADYHSKETGSLLKPYVSYKSLTRKLVN